MCRSAGAADVDQRTSERRRLPTPEALDLSVDPATPAAAPPPFRRACHGSSESIIHPHPEHGATIIWYTLGRGPTWTSSPLLRPKVAHDGAARTVCDRPRTTIPPRGRPASCRRVRWRCPWHRLSPAPREPPARSRSPHLAPAMAGIRTPVSPLIVWRDLMAEQEAAPPAAGSARRSAGRADPGAADGGVAAVRACILPAPAGPPSPAPRPRPIVRARSSHESPQVRVRARHAGIHPSVRHRGRRRGGRGRRLPVPPPVCCADPFPAGSTDAARPAARTCRPAEAPLAEPPPSAPPTPIGGPATSPARTGGPVGRAG